MRNFSHELERTSDPFGTGAVVEEDVCVSSVVCLSWQRHMSCHADLRMHLTSSFNDCMSTTKAHPLSYFEDGVSNTETPPIKVQMIGVYPVALSQSCYPFYMLPGTADDRVSFASFNRSFGAGCLWQLGREQKRDRCTVKACR
jgi:hypothetical protein